MLAWLDQARELSEYWIHRQQILQALGRPSDPRADLAAPVLDGLCWAWPYRLTRARSQSGDTVTIRVTGPVTDLAPGRLRAGPRAAASLTMTTEQAWRLLTSNLPAAGKADLAASGDQAIIGILLRTRAIIGTPKWT